MKLSKKEKSGFLVIEINGLISPEETEDMEEFIYKNTASKYKNIVIDLQNVPELTSSNLGALVRIQQTFKKQNSKLFLLNTNENISHVFSITGVNKYFNFVRHETELFPSNTHVKGIHGNQAKKSSIKTNKLP